MSSILLASLAYSGLKSKKKIELNYDSNIENKMNVIERQQVRQNHKKPELIHNECEQETKFNHNEIFSFCNRCRKDVDSS
jgi:hypothetical protein